MSISRNLSEHSVPIHPGEFLREDYMKPLGLSANALSLALHVPVTRVSEIAREKRGITADTALRLGYYFGTTPDLWLNMQKAYDLGIAEKILLQRIQSEIKPALRDHKTGELKRTA